MTNHEEIKKDLQRITKIEPFINKYNWEEIYFISRKDDWKNVEKQCLMFCMLKNKKYILLNFQNITQIVKNKLFF